MDDWVGPTPLARTMRHIKNVIPGHLVRRWMALRVKKVPTERVYVPITNADRALMNLNA